MNRAKWSMMEVSRFLLLSKLKINILLTGANGRSSLSTWPEAYRDNLIEKFVGLQDASVLIDLKSQKTFQQQNQEV